MQEKFSKIEEFLNNKLTTLITTFKSVVSKITPSKIKGKIEKQKSNFLQGKDSFKKNLIERKENFSNKFTQTKEITKNKIISSKSKSKEIATKIKNFDIKKINLKVLFSIPLAIIISFATKIKKIYLGMNPSTIVTTLAISTFGTLTGINIYKSSKKVINESRAPANAELVEKINKAKSMSRRPSYYKKHEKSFRVSNVILPIYLENTVKNDRAPASLKSDMRKLAIDFTFVSSNKYIKQIFWERPYLIMDRLNSNVEPISIEFPLEEEGKTIIKEKLKSEINILIKDLEIKGEIEDVYIHSIIGA